MTFQKRTRSFFIEVSVFLVIGGLLAIKPAKNKAEEEIPKAELFPYHVINYGHGKEPLIAYELHSNGWYYNMYPQYSAVIKKMDPARDDYKVYCKAVISDIKRMYPGDIGITIYDSYEAFWLNTVPHRFMTKQEVALVAQHTVATFNGDSDPDGECYCSLVFYEDAGNGLYEKQSFIVN